MVLWSSNNMSSFLLILLILNSTHFSLMANGRPEPNSVDITKREGVQDEKMMMMMRGLIGSRPPRCERVRCRSCGHCEAIQVPTNPQTKLHSPFTSSSSSSSEMIHLDYTRGDDSTNYKPMSWKCKCGNSIYNP
ncbi:PREDICTED: EPIDERMAL PATTERNING FACTOR-like protein 2 isoform X2 [Camelina sativa]|uniref:Epidermal patterning factor-like protein n=1 Tax=Camelina sativa TaxID=90675 RepID=A0ABM0U7N3_CAMSA|nr:PREDICTED: EPIDERMAL PATTERNING FACTOR-like protein 2 isoform X2 [Camelina sativa]